MTPAEIVAKIAASHPVVWWSGEPKCRYCDWILYSEREGDDFRIYTANHNDFCVWVLSRALAASPLASEVPK